MNPGETIVIERTANGFIVRQESRPHIVASTSDMHVFQDMGYASNARDNQDTKETLLGFIAGHFAKAKEKSA